VIARRARLAAALGFLLTSAAGVEAAGVRMLFPTDQLTEADPRQPTGRRIRLLLVNCLEAPSTCDEISLLQTAPDDRTVPIPTREQIIHAGDLQVFLSIYRHDTVAGALPPRFANPHGFITWTRFPDVAAIARAAQEQIARFFLSDGRTIERTDPRFDVPAAG